MQHSGVLTEPKIDDYERENAEKNLGDRIECTKARVTRVIHDMLQNSTENVAEWMMTAR